MIFARNLTHKKFILRGEEIFTLLTLLILGIYTALVTPFGAGFDEETHLIRIWQMSAFSFIPNEKTGNDLPYPAIFHDLSYRRDKIIRPADPDFWETYGQMPLDAHDYIYGEFPTRSVYSPLLLLPQSLVMRYMGRSWGFSALTVFYACRLIGLFCYIFLVLAAIRLIPFGKWPLAITAISPIALFQVATISTDSISIGIGILFIAGSLYLTNREAIGWKEWWFLVVLIALLFAAKVNMAFLVLLPIITLYSKSFKMKAGYLLLLLSIIVLALLEVVGWGVVGYSHYEIAYKELEGSNPLNQVRFILSNPLEFSIILVSDIWKHKSEYFFEWVAVYGYNYWTVPKITYALYPIALFLSLLHKDGKSIPGTRLRITLIIVCLISSAATIISLYIFTTPVGSSEILGVQGKYLIPITSLLFLSAVELQVFKKWNIPWWSFAGITALSLIAYLGGLTLSYHVTCGNQFYSLGLCYQPYYKNWAPDLYSSPPISSQMILTQEFVPECNDLTQMRLWVNNSSEHRDEKTTFTLRNTVDNNELVSQEIPNYQIPTGGWLAINFMPERDSFNKLHVLTIQNDFSTADPGISLAYSQPNDYQKGKLRENNRAVSSDLVFQYGCIVGLEKLKFLYTSAY